MDSQDGSESERNIRTNIEIEEVPASSAHSGEDSPVSGSNQYSTIIVEVDDESGSSKHSGLVADDGGESSGESDTHNEDIGGSQSSNPFETTPGVITSRASGFSHESRAMELPPIQVMDRSEGYDPFRIPASVFQTNHSSRPMDWSGASNESLFSISVDNSFSRIPISEELLPFSPSMIGYSPYIISTSMEADKMSSNLERCKADQASPITSDTKVTSSNQNVLKTTNTTESGTSSNVSTHSSSINSARSFAFPILTDAASNDYAKGEPQVRQQKQQQHPTPEVTQEAPKAPTRKSWFSWCCCSPCRWTCNCHCCWHCPHCCWHRPSCCWHRPRCRCCWHRPHCCWCCCR